MIVFRQPRLAKSRDTVARHDSVSSDCATSMCTALFVRQAKIQQHLFSERPVKLTLKGPKQQAPIWVNGSTYSSIGTCGKSAIGGWNGLAFLCRHLTHLDLIFLSSFSETIIQIFCWRTLLTYPVPSSWLSRCALSTEVVQLGVSLTIVLDAWCCNRDLNVSVDTSFKLVLLPQRRVTIWQC